MALISKNILCKASTEEKEGDNFLQAQKNQRIKLLANHMKLSSFKDYDTTLREAITAKEAMKSSCLHF